MNIKHFLAPFIFLFSFLTADEKPKYDNKYIYDNTSTDEKVHKLSAGKKVKLLVKVEISRDSPLVNIKWPKTNVDYNKEIKAHLTKMSVDLKYFKKGKTYEIDAIIVENGSLQFGAIFLYLESYKLVD